MPGIAAAAAIISGLVAAGTGVYNAVDQSTQNKRNMYAAGMQRYIDQFIEQQRYDRMRADELANWHRQNAYNSPEEQMNRLRQAGLNPHLVYGKGADATADAIKPVSYGNENNSIPMSQAHRLDMSGLGSAISTYFDTRIKQAQTDNINQNTALMQKDAILKEASTAEIMQKTAKTKFDLEQAQELKDSVIEYSKLQNRKLQADTTYTLDNNQRQALKNTQDVKLTMEKILSEKLARAKTAEEIKKIQADIDAVKQSTDIKRYQQQLTQMDIAPNDPWWFRGMMNMLHGNMELPSWMKGLDEMFGSSSTGKGGTFGNHRHISKGSGGNW